MTGSRAVRVLAAIACVAALLIGVGRPAFAAVADEAEWDFAGLVNQARHGAGLPALGVLPGLRDVARAQSARMAAQNRLHHNPTLGADIGGVVPDWQRAGENVGRGYDAPGLHDAFMASPGHRANVLGAFGYMGIGVVRDGSGMWVTEVFVDAPANKPTITRVPITRVGAAADPARAVAVSNFAFAAGESDAVVVGRADRFADALAGGPLAAVNRGPVLLTASDQVDAATVDEAGRVLSPTGTVFILGGVDAISPMVEAAFRAGGLLVERIAGPDRYATAALVARRVDPAPREVLVVSGANFPDAMSASAPAGLHHSPIVLTPAGELAPATAAYLATVPRATRVVVGGTNAVSEGSAAAAGATERVAGADRFETSVKVAQRWYRDPEQLSIAAGTSAGDALVGGPAAARAGMPVILVSSTTGLATYDYVRSRITSLVGAVAIGTDGVLPAEPLTLLFT